MTEIKRILDSDILSFLSEDNEGVLSPGGTVYQAGALGNIPIGSVSRDGETDNFTIEFETVEARPGSFSGSTIAAVETFAFNDNTVHAFPHNFTFQIFTGATDAPMSLIYKMGDRTDKLTPDVIDLSYSGKILVLEFMTYGNTDAKELLRQFESKRQKYLSELWKRQPLAGHQIWFGVIVVSTNKVVSNFNLSEEIITELCLRYRSSLMLYDDILQVGHFERRGAEDLHERAAKVKRVLENMEIDWSVTSKFKPFSAEWYRGIGLEEDQEYLSKLTADATVKSFARLWDEHFLDCEHGWEPCACKTSVVRNEKNVQECERAVAEHVQEYSIAGKPEKFRQLSTDKAVVQIPLWIPKECDIPSTSLYDGSPGIDGVNTKKESIGSSRDPTFHAWEEAFNCLNFTNPEAVTENEQLQVAIAMDSTGQIEKEFKPHRIKYHRIFVHVNDHDQRQLAKLGVNGKEMADLPEIAVHSKENKKGFSFDHKTDDIDEFFEEGLRLFEDKVPAGPRWKTITDLIKKSYDLHRPDIGTPWQNLHLLFSKSAFGRFCAMVTDLGTELSIAAKQHCSKYEYILKKLRHFPVYVLIKTTDYGKHVFYSLLIHEENLEMDYDFTGNVFKFQHKNGVVRWTDFVSVNPSKMKNLVECESMYFNLMWFYHELYQIPFWEKNILNSPISDMKDIGKMILLNLMVGLDDKARTEEMITNTRFLMMEGFVDFPRLPKPHKMIKKLPDVYRTRFQIWLAKKTFVACRRIVKDGKFPSLVDDRSLRWGNLFNFFTGSALPSAYQMINLFYIGYVKNKEEVAEKNSSSKMYGKILKYEDMMPKSYKYLGMEDPPIDEIGFHEFSPSLLKCAIKTATKRLKKKGIRMGKHLEDTIINSLGNKTLEELATLKASSTFDESWYEYKAGRQYKRCKVVEALRKYMVGDNVGIIDIIETCLRIVETRGGMHVDIFRKPQHGGLREIYVLAIEERVIQAAIETISRCLCDLFDSETMTHPENKARIPTMHHQQALKGNNNEFITVATSDDAEKWNQGHFVSKFAMMLCLMTPKFMHPLIVRGCSMFMEKRIMIDPGLMEIIANHSDDLLTQDEYTERMNEVFWGRSTEQWMRKNQSFITTKSGMMQGILHYTSSLLHSLLQELVCDWAESFMEAYLTKSCKEKGEVVISNMQSSDDSALIISFPVPNVNLKTIGLIYAAVCFEFKDILGRYLGIYTSLKSTKNTSWLFEFNSEFYFHTDVFRPTLRWVIAALTVSEQESLTARQEEMSSNLTGIVAGGGSFCLTAACQVGQSMLHYLLLGAYVNGIFPRFTSYLLQIPDPGLGFFLFDQPFFAGLAGFSYNLWNALKNSFLQKKYKLFLSGVARENVAAAQEQRKPTKPLQITLAGSLSHSTIIRWGDRKKAEKLLKDLLLPTDYLEQLDISPEVLYRKAKTGSDLLLRVAAKMHAPGVSTSLSKGNATVRIIASSVYIISRHCLLDTSDYLADPNSVRLKTTLLYEAVKATEQVIGQDLQLSESDWKVLFPFVGDFEYLNSIMMQVFEISGALTRIPHRRVFTKIQIHETEGLMIFAPEKLIKTKWFLFDAIKASQSMIDDHWERLKETMPWLCDNPADTLLACPFAHHTQLQNFFSRLDKKRRVIGISGAPIKRAAGMSNILTAARHNFFPGFEFRMFHDMKLRDQAAAMNLSFHMLSMISNGPFEQTKKQELVFQFLSKIEELPMRTEFGMTRRNAMAIIQKFCKNEQYDRPEEFMQNLSELKLGSMGGFHSTSKKVYDPVTREFLGYKGSCTWIGCVEGSYIAIYCKDNKPEDESDLSHHIAAVVLSDYKNLMGIARFLELWCAMTQISSLVSDNFVPPADKGLDKEALFRFYNGKIHSYQVNLGCPVYRSDNKSYYLTANTCKNIDLVVKKNSVKLIYNVSRFEESLVRGLQRDFGNDPRALKKKSGIRVPLVTIQFSETDTAINVDEAVVQKTLIVPGFRSLTKIEVAWLCNRSLTAEDAESNLNKIMSGAADRNLAARSIDVGELKEILQRCFSHACTNVGLAPRQPISYVSNQPVPRDYTEAMNEIMSVNRDVVRTAMEGARQKFSTFMLPESLEDATSIQDIAASVFPAVMPTDLPFTQEDMDYTNIAEAFREMTTRPEVVIRSHQLLYRFVQDLSRRCRSFRKMIEEHEYDEQDSEFLPLVAFLLGISEDDFDEAISGIVPSVISISDVVSYGDDL